MIFMTVFIMPLFLCEIYVLSVLFIEMMYVTVCALIVWRKSAHSIFPTEKGLMNACMELLRLSTSNKGKNQ